MKRGFVLLTMLALMLGLLGGCGGSGAADSMATDTAASESIMDAGDAAYGGNGAAQITEEPETAEGGADRLQDAKMIYTADLSVETTAFDDAAAGLRQLVEGMGGYFETASVYNYGGGYRSAYYTIRVPADQFQNLLTQVGELCHVVRQEAGQENISEQYYDVESRLVTQQTKLERLQTLLSQAETMEDIITIESAISETELAIEQLTGTLRKYDSLVDYSTVNISLEEVYRLSNTEEAPQSFGGRLGSAFGDGWRAFTKGLEDLAVTLAYSWMWVLLIVVIAIGAVRIIRRRHKLPKWGKKDETGGDKPDGM